MAPRPARPDFQARKSLGQHFLRDANQIRRIVNAAGDLTEAHVIEIGPGPGGLTASLLETPAASVTAVEIDPRAIASLADLADRHGERFRLITADARRVPLPSLVPPPRHVVANLPYNVATPLLIAWLGEAAAFAGFTLMFQAEVAERITAAPATPAYGRLAVLGQWTCRVRIAFRLPPEAFTPRPKVSSAVVSLVPHAEQPPAPLFAAMQRLTAAAFGQRRKMLRAALRPLGGDALLEAAGIAPERRAETLSIDEFDRLARLLPA
ncbi:MAG TPA: 16S rRNA (adenine(1518)-N(6)/adenine(1519)-N(6))-dimethyltransferase RsmA [Acetobacteraceae bacterium]|nr:16S rRNA (adenine(1518)-N(6)/adenine(1519)-N(6))-dimethyltransferase RsmA [Acetobacteraceae bacterium]